MKRSWIFCALVMASQMIVSSAQAADLVVCQNERCSVLPPYSNTRPYLEQIKNLLKASANGKIDFCDASPQTRLCQNNAIYWTAFSDANRFDMAIPTARINNVEDDIALDYVVEANGAYPRCMFSPLEISMLPDKQLRIVSYAYNCRLLDTEPMNIQKILYIDFIDLDKQVIGGTYLIQNGGAIQGETSGYALMQLRDADTPLPLIGKRYRNLAPTVPMPDIAPLPPELEVALAPLEQFEPEVLEPEDAGVQADFLEQIGDVLDRIGTAAEKILYFEPLD